ncbi:hypothetical protein VTO58DRAFT_107778 [Aureobasidium pullulans]
MPSNTSHIQKRDQLNQHPDLVLGTNDWQEPDQHLGFPTDFETRPAPVQSRQCLCGRLVIAGKRCGGCGRQN